MAKKQASYVVSASSTDDGSPVYRTPGGDWTGTLGEAEVFADQAAATQCLQLAQQQEREVCDPYAFVVSAGTDGKPEAVSARERIRAQGPTFRVRRPDPMTTA